MSPTELFNSMYITSSEVCKMLSIPRATIVAWKNNGKLPNAIEVPGVQLTIWEREPVLPLLKELLKNLNKRRGLEK
ncbi:hypothetical protein UFOVP1516_27 [uncultured Caudovirales phage]|uniref:Helix-turn-helix domain-containing protein n=1 Tax=uncultured Caudovirales phage TaxID=2100421 RepID=A0A6J7X7I9_9CAUD|nr:hypothetical protein UFOVP887_17 [uncultured Caudovirales phage]CAB5226792.1 hypothetical protein UFOVP1516_27 [uncultured Caudovirales phage]